MRTLITALAGLALFTATTHAGDTYQGDPSHAKVGFAVSHLVISKVNGQFKDFSSTLVVDEDGKLESATATIKVDSIDTENEDRDKHLKNEDFFDAPKYPEITFVSKKVKGKKIVGDFTMHGVTKEISLPYEIKGPVNDPWGNTKLGFSATIKIDRRDWGLTWSKALETGGLVVGNDVEISIDMEFAKAKAAE